MEENGPAAKAGLADGDLITSVAGKETNSVADLRAVVDSQPVGGTVAVGITRQGAQQTVTVTLEELPAK